MPQLKNRVPSYRLHKASGQAVVTLNGRDFYLGRYNSPESRTEYRVTLNEWLATARLIDRLSPAIIPQYMSGILVKGMLEVAG